MPPPIDDKTKLDNNCLSIYIHTITEGVTDRQLKIDKFTWCFPFWIHTRTTFQSKNTQIACLTLNNWICTQCMCINFSGAREAFPYMFYEIKAEYVSEILKPRNLISICEFAYVIFAWNVSITFNIRWLTHWISTSSKVDRAKSAYAKHLPYVFHRFSKMIFLIMCCIKIVFIT